MSACTYTYITSYLALSCILGNSSSAYFQVPASISSIFNNRFITESCPYVTTATAQICSWGWSWKKKFCLDVNFRIVKWGYYNAILIEGILAWILLPLKITSSAERVYSKKKKTHVFSVKTGVSQLLNFSVLSKDQDDKICVSTKYLPSHEY